MWSADDNKINNKTNKKIILNNTGRWEHFICIQEQDFLNIRFKELNGRDLCIIRNRDTQSWILFLQYLQNRGISILSIIFARRIIRIYKIISILRMIFVVGGVYE